MESSLVFPACLVLLLALVAPGDGIDCYVCNSFENALCADPFYHDDQMLKPQSERNPKSHDEFLQTCGDDKPYFCRKIYQNVRGDERVIRSCGWIEDDRDPPREKYTTVLEEYNTEVNVCKENKCNSSTMTSVSVMAILSSVVLGYLIH